MLFKQATRTDDKWIVQSDVFALELPRAKFSDRKQATIEIGLLGTREREKSKNYQWANNKTKKIAALLGSLGSSFLIDTRRDGVGGMGSWSPKEFSSIIPDLIEQHYARSEKYEYIHLPGIAPTIELRNKLRNEKLSWERFRDSYNSTLKEDSLDVITAFVESVATTQNSLPIIMCSEEHQPDFHHLTPELQDECYCHRFTLAKNIALRLSKEYQKIVIYSLDIVDFMEQWRGSKQSVFTNYQPSCWRIYDSTLLKENQSPITSNS